MTTIGFAIHQDDRRRPSSQDPSPVAGHHVAAVPAGPTRLRDLRERVRVLLDPPEIEHDPGRLTRLFQSWRTFARTHVQMTDGALALVVLAVGLLGLLATKRPDPIASVLLTFLLALPLAWRRRAPITVFLVIAVVAFAQWIAYLPLAADVALLVALYTVATESPRRAAVAAACILEGGAVLAAVRLDQSPFAAFAFLSGLVVAALVSGLYVRTRRSHLAGLVERAARLEFERDQQALLAATAERTRISREMHDVIAHSLAVVISLANGATVKLEREPEQTRQALESISEIGRQALADTRRLLSVLRTEEGTPRRGSQPGIEEIAELVDRATATGLSTTLTVRGDPVPVDAGVALSAYRIVQEAITNAVKHAEGASTVAVDLTWAPRSLQVVVTDNGHGDGPPAGTPNGFGLVGIRERAALYGGTATAGPGQAGGWTVEASIPVVKQGTL